MDRDEYIRFRDETALRRYREVLPVMKEELKTLSKTCAGLLQQYRDISALKDKHTVDAFYTNHCAEPFARWAYLSAEVGEIGRDIPRRVASINAIGKDQPEAIQTASTDKLF